MFLPQLSMPSILSTPTAEIPIHFFHLPVAQWEVLLVNVLTDPTLYESIIASPRFCDDPTFQQAIVLFRNYTLMLRYSGTPIHFPGHMIPST